MLPIINKFIEAIETDVVDKEFWKHCYQTVPVASATAKNKVWGWICNFFPFVGEERREQFSHLKQASKLFRERGKEYKTF